MDGALYATVPVVEKDKVSLPSEPTKIDHTFEGWYWDKDVWDEPVTDESFFDTPGVEERTAYAKWSEHTYGEWETVTETSCTTDGEGKRICSTCGYGDTKVFPMTGHNYGGWITVTAASCTAGGEEKRSCACGIAETRTVAMTEHFYGGWINMKAASCTTDGEDKRACECGSMETRVIAMTGHTYGGWINIKAASCTVDGEDKRACECGSTETRAVPMTGHKENDNWSKNKTHHWKECTNAGCTGFVAVELAHTYGGWTTEGAAEGQEQRSCKTCKHEETRATGNTEHIYGEWEIVTAATCTVDGEKTRTCTVSGCSETETDVIVATGHKYGSWTTVTEASCTVDGKQTRTCTVSGCSETETETITATEHTIVNNKEKAATCTESGWTAYDTCSKCDYSTTGEVIAATEHAIVNNKEKAATCTESGWTAFDTCSKCDYSTTGVGIPKIGHAFGEWTTEGAATGEEKRTCETCSHEETRAIEHIEHTYGEWETVKAASCAEFGQDKQTCACGHEVTRVIPKTEHAIVNNIEKAATCTESGWTAFDTCRNCDYSTIGEVIAATEHTIVNNKEKAATCTDSGWTAYDTCSKCDYSTTGEVIAATEHAIVNNEEKAATCTESGWTAFETCSKCDYSTIGVEIPKIEHAIVNNIEKAPTCTESGWTAFETCSKCDYSTTGEVIAATEHAIVNNKEKAATCTESGWTAYETCSKCDYSTIGVEIAATEHDKVPHAEKAATCTESGWTAYDTCSKCDYSTIGEVIAATEHTIVNNIEKAPTCTESGWTAYDTCSKCDYSTIGVEIAATEHDKVPHAEKAATCTEGGWTAYDTCSKCDYSTIGEVIPKTEHAFGEWTTEGAAEGEEKRTCETCSHEETRPLEHTVHTPNEDDGDCKTPITCSVCKEVTTAGKVHAEDTNWSKGEGQHWKECINENCTKLAVEKTNHTPNEDDNDCTTAITCRECEEVTTAAKVHAEDTNWSKGDGQHWKECTNDNCTKFAVEKTNHTPKEDDGDCTTAIKCPVCEEVTTPAKTHVPKATWEKDGSQHWKICNNLGCTKLAVEKTNHTPGTDDGDCTTPITCPECNQTQKPAEKEHFSNNKWDSDKNQHWEICATTGCQKLVGAKASHSLPVEDYDCTTAVTCLICNKDITAAKKTHAEDTIWRTGEGQHWKECTNQDCDKLAVAKVNHSLTTEDNNCMTAIECSICSHIETAAKAHDLYPNWNDGETSHWLSCKDCLVKTDEAAHIPEPDDNDCTTEITCTTCGHITTEAKAHVEDTIWGKNETNHWKKCINNGCTELAVIETKHASNGEWTTVTAPSCMTDGLERQTCRDCLYESTRVIANIGHKDNADWGKDDTSHWKTCANEGCTTVTVAKTNHTYSGTVCTVCKYVQDTAGLAYSQNSDGSYTVTGIGTATNATAIGIPATYNGKPVTGIADRAFSNNINLTIITIPKSMKSIGFIVFNECRNLATLIVAEGNPIYRSEGNCIIEIATNTLIAVGCNTGVVPKGMTTIGGFAFANSSKIENIIIPDSVTSIAAYALTGCTGLTSITVAEGNPKYRAEGNCIIEKSTNSLLIGFNSSTIPSNITSIGAKAFYNCTELKSVTIPKSVTRIWISAFQFCTSLESITYRGTKAEWKAIVRDLNWNVGAGAYTVICTDGNLTAAQS